ncbi:MAG: hypothetical protein IT438_15720 [Phycisphaerales bacterium]|nr:hypothetical protein [Phycisphaerales bacterium]
MPQFDDQIELLRNLVDAYHAYGDADPDMVWPDTPQAKARLDELYRLTRQVVVGMTGTAPSQDDMDYIWGWIDER